MEHVFIMFGTNINLRERAFGAILISEARKNCELLSGEDN
jgi:hypothetical protein